MTDGLGKVVLGLIAIVIALLFLIVSATLWLVGYGASPWMLILLPATGAIIPIAYRWMAHRWL